MVTRPHAAYRDISDHHFAVVRQNIQTEQKGFFAQQPYRRGEKIADFSAAAVLETPTYLTVQVGIDRHILLSPEHLQYINHSCEPNVFFDTFSMEILALKDIEVGDELTFFYPATEWDMAQPFACTCGAPNCLDLIRGAAHIPMEILKHYTLTRFIQKQLHDRSPGE